MSEYIHSDATECVHFLGAQLAKASIADETYDEAWRALGVVVSALYRQRATPKPSVIPQAEPVAAPKPTAPVVRATNGLSVCPHCGFESVTARGTRIHVGRMHRDKAQSKATAKEIWERSHASNIPYPGDAA